MMMHQHLHRHHIQNALLALLIGHAEPREPQGRSAGALHILQLPQRVPCDGLLTRCRRLTRQLQHALSLGAQHSTRAVAVQHRAQVGSARSHHLLHAGTRGSHAP
jgi:hypothetical protein